MRVIAVIALWLIAAVAAACPIPLEPTRSAFVTSVYIGSDGPFRFLVDTGSTVTVIDRAVAERLRIEPSRTITAVSTTGPVRTGEAVVAELRAGDVSMRDVSVLIVPLPRFPSHGFVHGLLGMNFFEGRSILFDVDRRCVDVDVPAASGALIDAQSINGRVAMNVDGLKFVIDSGASFPVLMSRAARSLAAREDVMTMTSAAGSSRAVTATVPMLRIGSRMFRDVAVALSDRDGREDGLLPVTLFHRVFIDAQRTSVRIE